MSDETTPFRSITRDAMHDRFRVVDPMAPIADVFNHLNHSDIGYVCVVDERGRCLGTLTRDELPPRTRKHVSSPHRDLPHDASHLRDEAEAFQVTAAAADSAAAFMRPASQTITADEHLTRAVQIMKAQQREFLPVLDENARPVGILRFQDAMLALAEEKDERLHNTKQQTEQQAGQRPPNTG